MRLDFPTAARARVREKRRTRAAVEKSPTPHTQKFGYFPVSSLEPHRRLIERWFAQGVPGTAMHAALEREHGYGGSYSSVYRMIAAIRA